MQADIQIGIVTLTIDLATAKDEEFSDAFESGLQCYCEIDSDQRQVTVDRLVEMMKGVVTDDAGLGQKFPPQWLCGFILGWTTGLNNPEIINDDPDLSYTESIIRKHIPLYRNLVFETLEPAAEGMEDMSDTEALASIVPEPARVP